MELSITGIANRKSRKAILRNTKKLSLIKQGFHELLLSGKDDWCLMVTFVEEVPTFFREVKNKDSIYQVEVGYGTGFSYQMDDDDGLLSALFDAVERVVRSYSRFEKHELDPIEEWIAASKAKLKIDNTQP